MRLNKSTGPSSALVLVALLRLLEKLMLETVAINQTAQNFSDSKGRDTCPGYWGVCQASKVEKGRKFQQIARSLGCPVVCLHVGRSEGRMISLGRNRVWIALGAVCDVIYLQVSEQFRLRKRSG